MSIYIYVCVCVCVCVLYLRGGVAQSVQRRATGFTARVRFLAEARISSSP
jgi:hypothetical protein